MLIVRVMACLWLLTAGQAVAAGYDIFGPVDKERRSEFYFLLHVANAAETDFAPSLLFFNEQSPERTRSYAFSFGRLFSERFFKWPVDVSWNIGLQRFDERGFQPDLTGVNVFTKLVKQFRLPWLGYPVRAGFGQGLSYVNGIPVAEDRDFEPAESERLLVYLEYTLQVSLSKLQGNPVPLSSTIKDIHFGYSVLHRSSSFGLFAQTGGGINYLGLGLEIEFK